VSLFWLWLGLFKFFLPVEAFKVAPPKFFFSLFEIISVLDPRGGRLFLVRRVVVVVAGLCLHPSPGGRPDMLLGGYLSYQCGAPLHAEVEAISLSAERKRAFLSLGVTVVCKAGEALEDGGPEHGLVPEDQGHGLPAVLGDFLGIEVISNCDGDNVADLMVGPQVVLGLGVFDETRDP
jgi:hypothetical protein